MGMPNFANRTIFHGDNLEFLRGLNSESVDLIATDPPFNKSKDFHATPDSLAAGSSFTDRWRWEHDVQQEWVDALTDDWRPVMDFINGVKASGSADMAAFLCWLGVRLLECRRILKPTGSLYLHIDHTAHAYAKVLLDGIFGRRNFRNEIVWFYKAMSSAKRHFPRKHDTLLWYSKSNNYVFNGDDVREEYDPQTVKRYEKPVEFPGGYKAVMNKKGRLPYDVWEIPPLRNVSKENVGYPTQKPLALYERIIKVSSNEGDMVLDPHCGCATTPVAAERLGRQWIGMDIWQCAYQMMLDRLNAEKQVWKPEDVRLITRPPERTDAGEMAAPYLPQLQGRVAKPPRFSREQMKAILIRQWSAVCWGCGFEPPNADDRFFDLDHDRPKAGGGSNELDNRAILCRPCNGRKSNTLTLEGLRRANKRDGYWYGSPPIDQRIPLKLAVAWAQEYLAQAGEQAVLPNSAD